MEESLEEIIESEDKHLHIKITQEWYAQELSRFSKRGSSDYILGGFWKILKEKLSKMQNESQNKVDNNKTIKLFEDYISSKESQKDKIITVKYKIQWMKAYYY